MLESVDYNFDSGEKENIIQIKSQIFLNTYDHFDWKYYIEYYNDLVVQNIKDKLVAWENWFQNRKNKARFFFKIVLLEKLDVTNFDWITYITLNEDLSQLNREEAWNHWTVCGAKEYRPYSRVNNSYIHRARFGNLFFVNMALHFIAMKNNLKIQYKYEKEFKELGIRFFVGENTYEDDFFITDNTFFYLIQSDEKIEKNICFSIDDFYCQTREFVLFIKEKFNNVFRKNIKKKNKFKKRYNNNEDVFIHIRLGDIKEDIMKTKVTFYYDKILSVSNFEKGYISSDSIKSELCQSLIKKYGLTVIDMNEIHTIMFASTCKYLILSGGTFSWLIGFLGFYSDKIYYPIMKNAWYSDIFVFPEWISVKIDS